MADATESKQIRLKVLTPIRVVYDELVNFVILRSSEGDMAVLHGHEPCSTLLDYGALRIAVNDREQEILTVLGGIVTVLDNEVTILSDMAERPENLQAAIAKLKEERAANVLREKTANLDTQRAEMAIRRSLVHMDVNAYSILKDDET